MAWMTGCSAVGSAPTLLSMRCLDKSPESLATRAIAGLPPSVESGGKTALTTGMTTDRRIFDFPLCRGIMAGIEYPGIAKLVSRLVWDQETVRSSRTTRTKIPLRSLISEGSSYSFSIAAQEARIGFDSKPALLSVVAKTFLLSIVHHHGDRSPFRLIVQLFLDDLVQHIMAPH